MKRTLTLMKRREQVRIMWTVRMKVCVFKLKAQAFIIHHQYFLVAPENARHLFQRLFIYAPLLGQSERTPAEQDVSC